MQAPTNGFFYMLDRETGKLISAERSARSPGPITSISRPASGRGAQYPL
jgi:glucose dehydrogenase